jgi:hypothetical protein
MAGERRDQDQIAGAGIRKQHRQHSWERFEGIDTDQSWAAFVTYRDTPPEDRDRARLAEKHRVNVDTITRWRDDAMWDARIAAYDRWIDRQRTRIPLRDLRAANVRHMKLARGLGELAAVECRKMLADAKRLVRENRLTPREIKQLADAAIKLERLTRGESTENVNTTNDLDLEKLSTEELSEIRRLQAKAKKGA